MAEPFLSEIRLMSFGFAPQGWALCNGQLLPINQNQALFSLLGTTYGGNGTVNFALPDLRGRVPIHMGGGHTLGERAGEQNVTLNLSNLPTHTHFVRGTTATATLDTPTNNYLAAPPNGFNAYSAPPGQASMVNGMVTNVGGSQGHLNMQPFLTLSFCIALQGIYPSQT